MSTLRVNTIEDTAGSNSSTPAAIANGIAKAWVNFNGTGTVAIRAQYNVSSITDNGTGDYTVNFTTALADANYSAQQSTGEASGNGKFAFGYMSTPTTTTYRIVTCAFNGANTDFPYIAVAIFR